MKEEIRILYLEDVPADAEGFDRELRKGGLTFRSKRVDTREDFLRALEPPPDIILSDHGLPEFDGLAALGLVQERCPNVPFVFVTNSLTREMELEKLGGKVADYVLKRELNYLPVAVERALRLSSESRLRRRLLEELRQHVAFATREGLLLPICSHCKKIRDEQNHWIAPELFFRNLMRFEYTHGLCPDCIPKFFPDIVKLKKPLK